MAWALRVLAVLAAVVLAGCAGHGGSASYAPSYAPTQYYAPPGTPGDPWEPYIREAAARFAVPEAWIRAVMAQESGGEEQAVSSAGAIGLMQVMPATYDELRNENGLGDDPFNPEDNILAGTAYIRQMYDRYGSPGFLAAYNAGPNRLDEYLAGDENLPDETINYLAAVGPNLGNAVPMSGPLVAYVQGGGEVTPPSAASFATGCDVDAAYDPDHPCSAPVGATPVGATPVGATPVGATREEVAAAEPAVPAQQADLGGCDADAAYNPDGPCTPAPAVASDESGSAIYEPSPAVPAAVTALPAVSAVVRAAPPAGAWGIQVGAFASAGLARAVAEGARQEAPEFLGDAGVALPATTPFGGNILYQARLVNLSEHAAADACAALNNRQLPCVVVQAGSS
jgi:hypothetical protein